MTIQTNYYCISAFKPNYEDSFFGGINQAILVPPVSSYRGATPADSFTIDVSLSALSALPVGNVDCLRTFEFMFVSSTGPSIILHSIQGSILTFKVDIAAYNPNQVTQFTFTSKSIESEAVVSFKSKKCINFDFVWIDP